MENHGLVRNLGTIIFMLWFVHSFAAPEQPVLPDSGISKTKINSSQEMKVAQYEDLKTRIEMRRKNLSNIYETAKDAAKDSVIEDASMILHHYLVDSVFSQWLGTGWDFYGTSEVPGQGSIACGYFVTTCLRDVGFHLPRAKLAQIASESMIRRLLKPQYCHRFSGISIDKFIKRIAELGSGVYIVGLDYHVGFLIVDEEDIRFCHSSFIDPRQVVFESAGTSSILVSSRYRVVGRILPNPELVDLWLIGDEVGQ